jgi:hypothetical protein
VVDLRDAYGAYDPGDLFVDPVHPGPMGHRIAAHALFQYLSRSGMSLWSDLEASNPGPIDQYHAGDFPQVRGY